MRNPAAAEDVQRLRAQMERMQGRRLDAPVLPTHPALANLLPGRGLRPGTAYSLGSSSSLLFALLAQPSQTGSWCGVVGMPGFGAEAAERAGVDLSRVVLIPDPGPRWLAVTATIADVLPVIAVRPPERAKDSDIAKLAARLRDRGAVLLVQGPWPQTEAMLDVTDPRWSGLGDGDGYLSDRELTVTVSSRRFPVPRSARMLLPAPDGALSAAPQHQHGGRMAPVPFEEQPLVEPIPMRRAV
ncbi:MULTISPECIES: hypothetical protein [Microbacterium]|uniref:Protein ImuA n=2 Tax=Microbacterium TaxID=33882 RepID=A0A9W6HH41_9MICO|nr:MULTISPECIES: hypothetical protein [Microbacterium]MDD7929339.1 hypothetical protein [Microbacterium thalli]MDD7961926.1 hypothetical protein [Microbacterium thalli]MDN8549163.1 hypothetical protein [Microbacterium thalli]BFE39426.1 hypothetical protein GCM10017544_03820 [Microbacterium imperiale]GLJ79707.1 hypothetical protein GCM10017586_13890 [Microbacterium imperiale]